MSDGRIIGSGRFRVDRRRALEKMERFQLEDPRRYVLELLAAAACSGTDAVHLYNDSDDLILSWTGTSLSGDELDGLFDHLFGETRTPRAALAQHLAIGVLAAHGLRPRWLRVDSGDGDTTVRLDVTDPTETRHEPLTDEVHGIRVHVRERLSGETLAEALRMAFEPPAETRLIAGAARWFPVPILVAGVPLPSATPPTHPVLELQGTLSEGREARLWLVMGDPQPLDLRRHGLVVQHLTRPLGRAWVTGWFGCDQLRLNASRSAVVEEDAWEAAQIALEAAIDQLLIQDGEEAEELRWQRTGQDGVVRPHRATRGEVLGALAPAIVGRLLERDASLGRWAEAPVLTDLDGRSWTVASLRSARRAPAVTSVAVPGYQTPHALFPMAAKALLGRIRADVQDHTEALELRAAGLARRRRAERSRRPPSFDDGRPEHRFQVGDLRGSIRVPRSGGEPRTVTVRMQIAGLPVEERTLPSPGGRLEAIVDHPAFTADPGFRHLVRDHHYAAALESLHEHILAHVSRRITAMAVAGPGAPELLAEALHGLAKREGEPVEALIRREELGLADLAVLPTGDGGRRSARSALAAEREWLVVSTLPAGLGPEAAPDVLLLPDSVGATWARWLGGRLGREALRARAERARRFSAPRRQARLGYPGVPSTPIRGPGLIGELASIRGEAPQTHVAVLRGGVAVCELDLDLGMPGLGAIVDGPELPVDAAHAALIADGEAQILGPLLEAVDRLAHEIWARRGEAGELPGPAVVRWLIARSSSRSAVQRGVRALPLLRTEGGTSISLSDITRTANSRSAPKLLVLDEKARVPGFEDALRRTPLVEALLEAWAPGRWRNATSDLEQARARARSFLALPLWRRETEVLASVPVSGEGWSGEAFLPTSTETIGTVHVMALLEGRALTTRVARTDLGVSMVVHGPAFRGNKHLRDVTDSAALTHLKHQAADLFPSLLTTALEAPGLPLFRTTWVALLHRVHRRATRTFKTEFVPRLETLPLFLRADGSTASVADLRRQHEAPSGLVLVDPRTQPGPIDHPGRVLGEAGVKKLLELVVGRSILTDDSSLRSWRESEARRRALAPREVELTEPVVARAPFRAQHARGELGIGLPHGPPGLHVLPMVDGRPLETVSIAFPVCVHAVVQGDGVLPGPRFRAVRTDGDWGPLVDDLLAAAHDLAAGHGAAVQRAPDWAAWVVALGLASPVAAVRQLPVLPAVAGPPWTLEQLLTSEGAAWVERSQDAPAGGWSTAPLVLDAELRAALRDAVPLVDLRSRRLSAPEASPDAPAWVELAPPRGGRLAVGASDAHEVYVDSGGGPWWRLPDQATLPIPLSGVVSDPAMLPNATWQEPDDPGAVDALVAALQQAARAGLLELAHAFDEARRTGASSIGSRPVDAVASLIRQAIRRTAPDTRGLDRMLAAEDGLLSLLAASRVWPDAGGTPCCLRELVAVRPVPCVLPGPARRQLASSDPIFMLDHDDRSWVWKAAGVEDAEGRLRREEEGRTRREQAPWEGRTAPAGSSPRQISEGQVSGTLWLTSAAGRVHVLVDGRAVQTLELSLPGVHGWIEGPFPVDLSFRQAELPDGLRERLDAIAFAMIRDEAGRDLRRARARVRASVDGALKALVHSGNPMARVPVVRRIDGELLSLGDLLKAPAEPILWTDKRAPPTVGEPLCLHLDADARRWIGQHLRQLKVEALDDWRERQTLQARAERAQRAQRERELLYAPILARVGARLGSRESREASMEALTAVVALAPDWGADPLPAPALERLAWAVASAVLRGDAESELALIAAVADSLVGRSIR